MVLSSDDPRITRDPALFTLATRIGPYQVYKTHVATGWLAEGTGKLSARTNRIAISNSDPQRDVVLRFHLHEALRCTRGCSQPLQPSSNPVGGVPFIRVPAPHAASFVIENSYEM